MINNNHHPPDQSLQNSPMSGYDANKMLANSAKYMINDALASVEGKRLVIEAEYCQGVCFGIQRGVEPSLYHVMGNKQATYDKAIELGAHAYKGWTRDVLPTFEDNTFNMVYMDYCCSPNGNTKCRPLEEMKQVQRILKPGGQAMFTFCKRTPIKGQNNMKVAKEHLIYNGFAWIDTIEYKVDGNQPMFVIICTKSWFEPFRAKHGQFNGEPNVNVTIPEVPFENWPHMCMCDMCGILYPDGVICKRADNKLYCKDCIVGSSKLRVVNALKIRQTAQKNVCDTLIADVQQAQESLATIPAVFADVAQKKLDDMKEQLATAQNKLAEIENKIRAHAVPTVRPQPAPKKSTPAPKKKRKRVPEAPRVLTKRQRMHQGAMEAAVREFCLNTQKTDMHEAYAFYNNDKKYSKDYMDCDLQTFQPIWEETAESRSIIQNPNTFPIIIEQGALGIELSDSLTLVDVAKKTSPFCVGDVILRLAGEDVRGMEMDLFAKKLAETSRPCTVDVYRC